MKENNRYFGEDYFSRRMGFIIEGLSFKTADAATRHLREKCDMNSNEATRYIKRLLKEAQERYAQSRAAARGEVSFNG